MSDNYLVISTKSSNSIGLDKDLKKINLEEGWENLSFQNISIKLDEVNELDEYKNVAYLQGYYYDLDYIYSYGADLFSIFDMTGDTSEIYNIFFENNEIKPEYGNCYSNIFYIDRIYVTQAYRNQGYAKFILSQIEAILKYIVKINVGLIIVCAQPFEKDNNDEKMIRDNDELKKQLINLYKNCGFTEVKNIDLNEKYLFKICDELI